ncbi:hypothetical protein [Sphingomonas sp. ERG5]|uniref:hypothetical protein n=1 Tax=Sphingomonas sp. ERG5 TaxID=1381597 RepID=UPI00068B4B60|nr:hypothetical protein [Sphingomonas sp. ERG5]
MLPRLQAEEQMAAVDSAALGAGSYNQDDAQRMMRRLRDTASGQNGERGRSRGRAANPGQLAAMGISVSVVPSQEALSGG